MTKQFVGKGDQNFPTLSGYGERMTPKDVQEQERLARAHEFAEQSEKEYRRTWLSCEQKGLDVGIDYAWLGSHFEHRGDEFRVIGLRLQGEEAHIMARVAGQDRFVKMRVDYIKQKLGIAA